MAINNSRLVNFGELKATVETMKVYIDSDKTISIKGYKQINNTHYFYSTSSPTDDSVPVFSFDIAEEMFLDQTKTKFIQEFTWSAETYVGSINPNLDGKPVMVLAVKGEDSVTYSFLDLEGLVGTYTTKNTNSLSLAISEDGEISGDVKVSEKEGNAITVEEDGLYATGGSGEEPLVVDFRYKSNGEGYEAYGFTHTNAEIIEAINNDRTVIMKGLIDTARDYAPYVFQLHTYMKNSGRYEFVYSKFSNYMEITEYNLNIYTNDDLEFLVNTYKVNQTIPEMPYGDEGQFVSFDEEGNLIAVDAPSGGEEPTLVSFVYEATTGNNTWTVHSVDKTYDEIKTALSENKRVIAKGTNKNARLDNPWYFYPNEYYNSAGNWVVFERININGSLAIEAFRLTVNGDGTATLVETEVSQVDLSNYVQKEEGKGLSANDLTDDLLAIINSDHTYAKFTNTAETSLNNITTNGKYLIDNSSGNKTNCPSDITRFELYVVNFTRYTVQLAFGIYAATTSTTVVPTPAIYVRSKDTMTYSWSTWSTPSASYASNAGTANKLAVSRGIYIDLASSTTAEFDGSESVNPGVYGILPLTNGGTGSNTAKGAQYNLLNNMNEVTTDVSDTSEFVGAYISDASATNGIIYKRPASSLWNYIKSKISSVLGLTATSYSGNAASATKLATQCGILVNLGSFTTGYLDGTVPVEPGIQGTLPLNAGGTGATNASTARNNLNVPPTNHASAGTTYGKGGPSSYGHLKVSDDYEASPNTGVNASNAVAASLYAAQRLNGRLIELETQIAGYSLVGTVTFGITMESNSVSTACTVKNEGGTLPFNKGGGGTNTTAYFKPTQSITYACKLKRKHAYYSPQIRCNTSIPTATSVTPTGTICLTDAAMALPSEELSDVVYEDISFSTSNYYYAYHSGGSSSGVSYADRGGVLYCYAKG